MLVCDESWKTVLLACFRAVIQTTLYVTALVHNCCFTHCNKSCSGFGHVLILEDLAYWSIEFEGK